MIRSCAMAMALVCFCAAPALAQSTDRLYQAMGPVGAFELRGRDGQTVTREDLRGKTWVAHFFYCLCQEGCAQTTANMARLQETFAGRDDLRLVSIHVNPHDEDPQTLYRFADSYRVNPERWLVLRPDPDDLEPMLKEAFKVGWARDPSAPPSSRVTHSFFLLLIDPRGEIVGYVDGRDPVEVDRMAGRIHEILRREQIRALLPSVNASLNGLALVLLLTGYAAIRWRRETLHIGFMIAALVVSALFLACYGYYHYAILRGQPTQFAGTGSIRPLYYGILWSHIALAPVVLVLALATAYLGLRDRRAAHRRLARWTFPLWLYVSITGVVVYWMLYHLYPS